jgi:hypothetical protein
MRPTALRLRADAVRLGLALADGWSLEYRPSNFMRGIESMLVRSTTTPADA